MRMCTRYGLNDLDSESTSAKSGNRWDQPENLEKQTCTQPLGQAPKPIHMCWEYVSIMLCVCVCVWMCVCVCIFIRISLWVCVYVRGTVWMTVILNPPWKAIAAVGTSPKANKNMSSMCSIMLYVCVCVKVCAYMCMCMYKSMCMCMCTQYGLNDGDSYSKLKTLCIEAVPDVKR